MISESLMTSSTTCYMNARISIEVLGQEGKTEPHRHNIKLQDPGLRCERVQGRHYKPEQVDHFTDVASLA